MFIFDITDISYRAPLKSSRTTTTIEALTRFVSVSYNREFYKNMLKKDLQPISRKDFL